LEVQQRIGFRDIITGDESWFYLDVAPNSSWTGAEEAAPTPPRTTIASTKTMLAVFWGIRCTTLVDWLAQNASFNGEFAETYPLKPEKKDHRLFHVRFEIWA
jgi:hypothetical protein